MARFIKYVLIIILLIATFLFIMLQYRMIWNTWCIAVHTYYFVILPSLIIYVLFFSRRLTFIENLIHELTHMLFAALSFQRINGLYVTATGGVVDTVSDRKSIIVTLSPYFFPLLTILLICFFNIVDFRYGRHIVIVNYILYLAVTLKYLVKGSGELLSTGVTGFILVLILNFWISYFIFSWCAFIDLNIKGNLINIYDGIT